MFFFPSKKKTLYHRMNYGKNDKISDNQGKGQTLGRPSFEKLENKKQDFAVLPNFVSNL